MLSLGPIARLGGAVLAACVVCSLLALPADAKKKRKGKAKGRTVALFYVAKNNPDAKLYGTLAQELTKAQAQVPDLKLVWGKSLKKLIRKKPDAAINKCGSNIKCIAKLGRKAKAKEVIYARVTPAGKGIKAQFLVVDVAGKSVTRRVEMEVDSLNALTAVLPAKIDEMFGVATADTGGGGDELSLDMVLGDDTGGGDELPLEIATGPTPAPADDGPSDSGELELSDLGIGDSSDAGSSDSGGMEELALDFSGTDDTTDAPPTDEPTSDGPPPFDDSSTTEIAALDADMSTSSATVATTQDSGGVGMLTYVGAGIAGVGAIGLGLGGLFGAQAASKRDTIEYGAGNTTQVEAQGINKDANALANRANLMFGIGGGLLLAGGALLVVDLMTAGDSKSPTTSVSVGDGSASLQIGWSW